MMDIEELQGQIIDRVGNYNRHRQYAIAEALEAGRMLNEARAILPHGEWTPFVESVGLKMRTARRWMVVAESGLQIGQVAAFGGLEFTARLWRALSKGKRPDAVRAVLTETEGKIDWEFVALQLPHDTEIAGNYAVMVDMAGSLLDLRAENEELEAETARLEALAG